MSGMPQIPEHLAPPPSMVPGGSTENLTKARTETEAYKARLARLSFEQKSGKLLLAEEVREAMKACAAAAVREIDRLPRQAEDLAGAFTTGGVLAVRAELRRVARDLKRSIADSLRALERGDLKPRDG